MTNIFLNMLRHTQTLIHSLALCFLCSIAAPLLAAEPASRAPTPNIIYVMIDELGYYETGFMGSKTIQTPHLDKLAAEGVVFRNMYAGGVVCAPTRCCLMTGKHAGHTSVRANDGGTPLRAEEQTIASLLKARGYATGGFGKWGLGGRDSTGVPEKHGFDVFFGYYDQVHAHTFYPPYLIRNSEEVPLKNNRGLSDGETYSQYVIHDEALKFIRANAAKPFFAYLPYTPPHALLDIPDNDPAWALYKDKSWPMPARRYAAMVTMVDRQVGEVVALLKELKLDDNTVIMFSGDNGGHDNWKDATHPRGIHSANRHPETGVEFRGTKGAIYEGGLRVPSFVHWPKKIAGGRTSEMLAHFPDVLPTITELTGAQTPKDVDGISLVPELLGKEAAGRAQPQHEYLFWEASEARAVRQGDWRAVLAGPKKSWELYNLKTDPAEATDLAAKEPAKLEALKKFAEAAHQPVEKGTYTSTDRHERDRAAKGAKGKAGKK